jgi:uncharacterized membrane protein YphA (DoxX/SURF4 family)
MVDARDRAVSIIVPIARVVVGGIFLIAALDKVQAPGAFADAVRAFHLLPPALVLPFALVVPWFEVLVAVYLLAGFLGRLAAGGAIALLLSFEFALGSALARGDTNHACGCFGSGSDANPLLVLLTGGHTITWWDPVRDLLLIALAGAILVWGAGPLSVDVLLGHRRERLQLARRAGPGQGIWD